MKSLYLRIWLTVVAALALFALVSGWMWHRHLNEERVRFEALANERLQAWAELVHRSLPAADAPPEEQAAALLEWSQRLRVPLALDDVEGHRLAASDSFRRRLADGAPAATSVRLDDGRTLWLARRMLRRPPPLLDGLRPGGPDGLRSGGPEGLRPGSLVGMHPAGPEHDGPPLEPHGPPSLTGPGLRVLGLGDGPGAPGALPAMPFGLPRAVAPLVLVAMLFVAVAAGAYPVVRRLTRRLEALERGVEAFGHGDLSQRVDDSGSDEVAKVAATFNRTAERIEVLVRSHQSLLANASHELRSPLARLKMAVAMFADLPEGQRAAMRREIDTNVAELDALVEEVLLASRLDSAQALALDEQVDLLGVAAEEAARVGAELRCVDTPGADGADGADGGDGADGVDGAGGAGGAEANGAPLAALGAAPQPGQVLPPQVRGSERLLRRALRNLLENARRYAGDDVLLCVGAVADGQVSVEVCDRGPGVPAELRERIFEPFYRLPGHAEREGGVGLGLSLVRQIALRHGGSVRCVPREGGGSCFVLSLPA